MEKNIEYKLKKNIDKLRRGKSTGFLDLRELKLVTSKLKKDEYQIYYPFNDAEKVILYCNKVPDISLIKINSFFELKHSEILGSLFGLNINSEFFGDIIIDNGNYYIIVLPEIKEFIMSNLFMIGNKYVELDEVSLEVINNYKKSFENKEIIVSSLRIDNVIARILNTSRSIVKEKIQNKEIILNYDILKNSSYLLRDGDIFSVRRYGKYKFLNIVKTTKKENYIIEYQKYI
jgi:RNA-binding protein YlmH